MPAGKSWRRSRRRASKRQGRNLIRPEAKIILEQSHLGTEVELEVGDEKIIIRSASHPRQGWNEKFQLMAKNGDDKLVDADLGGETEWDQDEWE